LSKWLRRKRETGIVQGVRGEPPRKNLKNKKTRVDMRKLCMERNDAKIAEGGGKLRGSS